MLPFIFLSGYSIPTYILMGVIAYFVSSFFIVLDRKNYKICLVDSIMLCIITFFAGILGAKAFHLVGEIVKKQNIFTIDYWNNHSFLSGFVWYGGVIAALLFIVLYCKVRRLDINGVLDLMTFFALTFDAIGRIGCLLSGCCYGVEIDWGIPIYGINRFPSPLFESALCVVILLNIRIWKIYLKNKGMIFSFYLLSYAIGRFILEFLRGDITRGRIGIFSTSQWISIVIICAFVFYGLNKKLIKSKCRNSSIKDGCI